MMLIEETRIAAEALPLGAFKAHLRMGSGFGEEGLQEPVLESFLRAAIAGIEARTGKVLLSRDFALTLEAWRDTGGQPLPLAPVSDVTDLAVLDRDGAASVLATGWDLRRDPHFPVLRPAGTCLPPIPSRGSARIRFVAGYGATWDDVPPDLAQAVLLLAAHYYEHRDETALGRGCTPFGVTTLIDRYRPLRLGAGAGL